MTTLARRRRSIVAAGAAILAIAGYLTASGQAANVFDLSFGNFTSGGGQTSGGTYSVYGVLGQPQVGVSIGGSYAINSGLTGGASIKFRAFAPFISSDR